VEAGHPAFTLKITGSGFTGSSTVSWDKVDLATTYTSPSELSAAVPADMVSAAGTASITVFNPAPGGGVSNSLPFTINNPANNNSAPVLTSIEPGQVAAGSVGFTLRIRGSGFINNSLVRWDGVNLTTTYVSADELTAAVPASKVAAVGSANITVFNPPPGGGESNQQAIQIFYPTPNITDLSPNQIKPGGAAFYLTVAGSGFMNGSLVRWGEKDLVTTYVNGNQLSAYVPAALIAKACTVQVSVINPGPGGSTSASTLFMVTESAQQKKIYLPLLVERGA
jgi:hypothetical protein